MLSGNCTEALSIQANVKISGSSAKLIRNSIAPLPFPTAIELRSADFSPPRSGPAQTAGSGLKSALLSCRNSLNPMPVEPERGALPINEPPLPAPSQALSSPQREGEATVRQDHEICISIP